MSRRNFAPYGRGTLTSAFEKMLVDKKAFHYFAGVGLLFAFASQTDRIVVGQNNDFILTRLIL